MAEDKIGGTPHAGRMAPGAERGGVRNQRRPLIDAGKPSKALEALSNEAIVLAKHLRHKAEVWRMENEAESGQIRCVQCGMKAGFALVPMAGKDQVNGAMLGVRCPRSE